MNLFNQFQRDFIQNLYIENSEKLSGEINIVSKTIKNKKILTKKFYNEDKDIIQIIKVTDYWFQELIRYDFLK